jgi:arginyl-tRNA synthetase
VDRRQKLHFDMLLAALQKAGWIKTPMQFNHLAFGTVLGADKKPFKTRGGETIKLIDLLDKVVH